MKSKRICLILTINFLYFKNVALEENFTDISPTQHSKLEIMEKLSNVEHQNVQMKKLLEKHDYSKQLNQIVQLLEETKEKEAELYKALVETKQDVDNLAKKLEAYDVTVDSFKGQLEVIKEQIKSKLDFDRNFKSNELSKMHVDETIKEDCKEIQYETSKMSGVYTIQPANTGKPFMVWCDMETRGGGWIYLLNRFDGSVNFSLNWSDYKQGFGDLKGELWLGLQHLYELTSSKPSELLIELKSWDDREAYAIYSHFEIGNEDEGYVFKNWGTYSGDAGNSMRFVYGQKFSTEDNDQDWASWNCAKSYRGGWWYKNCFQAKLTGEYLDDSVRAGGRGIHWQDFAPLSNSLKTAKMMIRPVTQN